MPEEKRKEHGEEPEAGVLYIVSTPIGNLDDITLRALKILRGVEIVAAEDTRKTGILLDRHGIDRHCVSYHARNAGRSGPALLEVLQSGGSVALVSDAGTPGISDPAALLVAGAVESGIRVVPIPGASALLAALVASGLHTEKFVFEGFLPVKKRRATRIRELEKEKRTIVLYESPHRILRTLREISEAWGSRRVVLGRELTKKFEEFVRGDIEEVIRHVSSHPVRGEYVIVIEGSEKSNAGSSSSDDGRGDGGPPRDTDREQEQR